MIDNFMREINYARISVTSACNLKCTYCFTDTNVKKLKKEDVFKIIDSLALLNFKKVRLTGGEPLLHSDIKEIVEYACNKILDVGITTNGVNLDKFLEHFKKVGLKRINISLDTMNDKHFYELTRSDQLQNVIDSAIKAKKMGFIVKINTVLIKEYLSDAKKFLAFGKKNNIQIRFIELMPIGNNSEFVNINYTSADELIKLLNAKKSVEKSDDVCDYYFVDNYQFGIISPISNHFCNSCNRIRFTSDYKLRLCLHAKEDYSIREHLNSAKELKDFIKQMLINKQEKHNLNCNEIVKKNMVEIGG